MLGAKLTEGWWSQHETFLPPFNFHRKWISQRARLPLEIWWERKIRCFPVGGWLSIQGVNFKVVSGVSQHEGPWPFSSFRFRGTFPTRMSQEDSKWFVDGLWLITYLWMGHPSSIWLDTSEPSFAGNENHEGLRRAAIAHASHRETRINFNCRLLLNEQPIPAESEYLRWIHHCD